MIGFEDLKKKIKGDLINAGRLSYAYNEIKWLDDEYEASTKINMHLFENHIIDFDEFKEVDQLIKKTYNEAYHPISERKIKQYYEEA